MQHFIKLIYVKKSQKYAADTDTSHRVVRVQFSSLLFKVTSPFKVDSLYHME